MADTEDDDFFRAMEHRRAQALVARDLAVFDALHAPDYELVTPAGRTFTAAAYREAIAREPFYAAWTAGEMRVRRSARMAWVRYPAVLRFPSGREVSVWHTDAYERRERGWQAVWSQATEQRPTGPTSPVVREIGVDDVASLFEVRIRTRENRFTMVELAALGITPASVTQWLAGTRPGWLCEDSGRTVGFCMVDHATAELLVIAVLPEYEGRGIGAALMTRAEGWLRSRGCARAWLTTDLDMRLRAYGFYRGRGWTDWKQDTQLRYMARDLT